MPEIGPSGSEGGVALARHPYPYRTDPVCVGRAGPSRTAGRAQLTIQVRPGGDRRAYVRTTVNENNG
jgi:hypothetical protein